MNQVLQENKQKVFEPLLFPEIDQGYYWYLATPYTDYPAGRQAAHDHAVAILGHLTVMGARVFCPIAHNHNIKLIRPEGWTRDDEHQFWMRVDRPFMASSHGIIVACMDGFQHSRGVAEEIDFFERHGRPVYFLSREWVNRALGVMQC